MTSSTGEPHRSRCPINASLEVFGDRWSLLIVRDLMLKGAHTFKDFMAGGEVISTNVLSDRLERLVAERIVAKSALVSDRRRFVYQLTEKGIDLAPIVMELILWGARYADTDAAPDTIRSMRRRRDLFLARTRKAWEQQCVELGEQVCHEP